MTPSWRAPRTALAAVLAGAILAACTAAATPSVQPSQPPGAVRVEVTLSDALRIEPASITVPAGKAVVFVVKNTGRLEHEFFVGDEKAQADHEQAMMGSSGMIHDEPNGIGLKAGQAKELTMTFPAAGTTLAGCHIPGHYAAGMKATIQVQ